MKKSDILMHQSCAIPVKLSHQCVTENGIESDEIFVISKVIGDFEQLEITNQYGMKVIINPNQIAQ